MKYLLLEPNETNIIKVEKIRYEAYDRELPEDILETFYAMNLKTKQYLIFAAILGDEICAACYVSRIGYSLFIDQLFVKKEYQNTGLKIGRKLLEYINNNKNIIEEELSFKPLQTSRLISTSEKSHSLYLKLGYKDENKTLGLMSKHI